MGLCLDDLQRGQFLLYLDILRQWSSRINLTSIHDPKKIIDRHFFDSLALWKTRPPVNGAHHGRLLDVGSGAGFPGVPLKLLAPNLELTLLEPRLKRSAFLQVLISALSLTNSRVVTARLADLPKNEAGHFEWIVVRGVGQIDDLARQAADLLTPGGSIAFYLSGQQSAGTLRMTGFETSEYLYQLPFSGVERRLLLILRSTGNT